MSATLLKMPGTKEVPATAPKGVRSVMDTLLITPSGIDRWKTPPFQREKRITPKVRALIDQLKADGGVVPGIITLGKLKGETWLVDGQHRIEAFRQSGLGEGVADVRICHFETIGEMSDEFVTLNSSLVRMTNDDILRGLEATNEHLSALRRKCPFLGYDRIGYAGGKKTLAMSAAIRVWFGSDGDCPNAGPASTECAKLLSEEEVRRMAQVLGLCFEAWGTDESNRRLWGKLNLAIVMWLWRRVVLRERVDRKRGGVQVVSLTPDQFRLCLLALSAHQRYVEWLLGRSLKDRDRSPCYGHVKGIFAGRIGGMGLGRPIMPSPEWASK